MTAWAKPADLLIAYKFASASEWRRHIAWLEKEGYPWLAQLEKERARAGEVRGKASQREDSRSFGAGNTADLGIVEEGGEP